MSEIVEVKNKRSSALKKAQKKYINTMTPEKKELLLIKRRKAYELKKSKSKEDKEAIHILKEDMEKQTIKINSLEAQKAELLKIRNLIDTLLN